MARIYNVSIPDDKNASISLTYIFGVGRSTSQKILRQLSIDVNKKTSSLTNDEVKKINFELKKYNLEGDLKRQVSQNISDQIRISCYRGLRRLKNLPIRGQNTRSNARTAKGNKRKTVANKAKPPKTG